MLTHPAQADKQDHNQETKPSNVGDNTPTGNVTGSDNTNQSDNSDKNSNAGSDVNNDDKAKPNETIDVKEKLPKNSVDIGVTDIIEP